MTSSETEKPRELCDLIVRPAGEGWTATFGERSWRCAVGRGGLAHDKREGDGATPIGRWPFRRVLYRADRLPPPETSLPLAGISPKDGWCDDSARPEYNRLVQLPFEGSHEELWRADSIYDIVAVLGHNDDPPISGAGSAIFLHLAREHYEPTAGCVALALPHLLEILAEVDVTCGVRVRAD